MVLTNMLTPISVVLSSPRNCSIGSRKLQVEIYHDTLGHCNNLLLTYSLKKMGVSVQHLLPYINRYKCNGCTVNGRRGYLFDDYHCLTNPGPCLGPDGYTIAAYYFCDQP